MTEHISLHRYMAIISQGHTTGLYNLFDPCTVTVVHCTPMLHILLGAFRELFISSLEMALKMHIRLIVKVTI